MKTWGIFIVTIVILVMICSPVAAISKTDLIASYELAQDTKHVPEGKTFESFFPTQYGTVSELIKGSIRPAPTPTPTNVAPDDSNPFAGPSREPIIIPTATPTPIPQIPSWFVFSSKEELISAESDVAIFNSMGVGKPNFSFIKGKPNIYLYSDRDLTAQVRLAPEKAITVSEPLYQPGKGWRAEIMNGSLNGAGDFLFYEARGSDSVWQKEEGYFIHAAYREEDMAFMLIQYGFNEKETREFIDYWASHLVEDVDFVFYPQETEAVNQDMPLSIRPNPDNVMRIWFLAEPLVSAPEPVTHPEKIVREGFYVVEWGVIIQNQYWNRAPDLAPEEI